MNRQRPILRPACRTCFRAAPFVTPGRQVGAVSLRPSHYCASCAPAGAIPLAPSSQPQPPT